VSFRGRLRLFFVLLVIVPMIALAVVLFTLTSRSETGKADAGISAGTRTAFGVYEEAARRAAPALHEVASDRRLRAALAAGSGVDEALERLVGGTRGIVCIELYSQEGQLIARVGSTGGVAPRGAPIAAGGQTLGTLAVSVTAADRFAGRVRKLTGLEAAVYRDGRLLAATTGGLEDRGRLGGLGDPHDVETESGAGYRARVESISEPAGPPVQLALLDDTGDLSDTISENRLVIGGLLLAFLLLAVFAAVGIGRALTGQVGTFLGAARRLARGDFTHPVPVTGRDEFAQLGREFNSMSSQLQTKIVESERRREELEATIRRVGDALATGLDRDGVVALAVRQAVDACDAEAGRALPLEQGAFHENRSGRDDATLNEAIVAAEKQAFEPRAEVGPELLDSIDPEAPPRPRRASAAQVRDAHALAVPMRAVVASSEPEYLGVLSIARRGRPFSREEEELLEYLSSQAIVSIENASLHATVERQAVTDELTGLANARAFRSILDREIERSRRFQTPLGLLMADLDDFKQVNDRHGHPQGDEVLASVAAVLRDLSRDIDAPARYGGEELAVVLPQTDAEGAALLAERMREAVERLRVPRVSGRGSLRVTASFGVASMPESASDGEQLVAAADAALYRAKRGGKNRVERADRVVAAG
jgi:diguanylate cyclase (GGDEF)-like protein